MTDTSQGAGSGSDSTTETELKEYMIPRDSEGPYSFAGVQLARAVRQTGGGLAGMLDVDVLEAAVYRTRGGKFITALSKTRKPALASQLAGLTMSAEEDDARDVKSTYRKAALHETFEDAVAWFKPGRLTDEIRKQLGLDKPVRIE
jgi:hypothetical protein